MQVSVPIVKGRKQESGIRSLYDPVSGTIFNTVFFCIVAETGFVQFYRTDTAHKIFVGIVGSVKHFHAVFCFFRNIISGMNEDDIVVFSISIMINDFLIEFFQHDIVSETAVTKL